MAIDAASRAGRSRPLRRTLQRERQIRRRRMAALALLAVVAGMTAFAAFPPAGGRDDAALLERAEIERALARSAPTFIPVGGLALDRYARGREERIGVAVAYLAGGRPAVFGNLEAGQAWSAIKVPLGAAYLDWRRRTRGAPNGSSTLSALEERRMRLMLTRSDNAATRDLFQTMAAVEGRGAARGLIERMLRRAGDRRTRVAARYGTTRWRLVDALGFYRELARGCLLTPADTAALLGLMRRVIPEQRWGFAAAAPRGVPVAFKGGWGLERRDQWFLEQFAIVGGGATARVVGLMTRPGEAGNTQVAFDSATESASRTARFVVADLAAAGRRSSPPARRCPGARNPRPRPLPREPAGLRPLESFSRVD